MKILLLAIVCFTGGTQAQSSITSDLVEGGKTIVELIKVFRTPRSIISTTSYTSTDSCGSKKLSDICFKNKTDKLVLVSLYQRNGNTYETKPLSLSIAASTQENLYEIKSGIYKYKIEIDSAGQKTVLHEGELKLQPCDKAVREIRE